MQTTGVVGYVLEGAYVRAAQVIEVAKGEFRAIDRSSRLEVPDFDPMLARWLNQRWLASALARLGKPTKANLVRLTPELVAELKKDSRGGTYSTEEFIRKMDAKRADTIIAGLVGTAEAIVDEAEDLAEAV